MDERIPVHKNFRFVFSGWPAPEWGGKGAGAGAGCRRL
jgi:hypothetical protein